MTTADEYQRVLLTHQRIPMGSVDHGVYLCTGCDDLLGSTDGPNSPRHAAHVAQTLAADPGVRAAVEREARAEAWDEGRNSLALDFTKPMNESGMRPSTPNPYRQEPGDGE